MTSQQQLVCDSSTLANFKAWAQPISTFFSTAGWIQTSDTGQVNWASIGAVPGSGAFVYEIWKPGDALTVFYVKIEYGNVSGTNCPSLRLTLCTGTNGAGTPTGFSTGALNTNISVYTPASTTTQYECNFSGDTGRIAVMMWRNQTSFGQQLFAIERSKNSSGADTSSHVTLITAGTHASTCFSQVSLVFGVGVAPNTTPQSTSSGHGGLLVRGVWDNSLVSGAFNGMIPFDLVTPYVGFYDYPLTQVGSLFGADVAEGVTFQVTVYGATRTYMPSKNAVFNNCAPMQGSGVSAWATCMRYD